MRQTFALVQGRGGHNVATRMKSSLNLQMRETLAIAEANGLHRFERIAGIAPQPDIEIHV